VILVSGAPLSLSGKGDFPAFYRAAVIVASGERQNLYDPATQNRFELQIFHDPQKVPQYFYHPPFEVLLLLPLAFLPYQIAFWCWLAANVVLLLFSARVLSPQFRELRRSTGVPISAFCLAFFPVAEALLQGQDSILLLFVLALAYRQFCRKQDASCGVLLGLGLFKFQHIIPLVAILAFRWRPRLVAAFAATAIALFGASWALVGTPGLISYWHILWHHVPEEVWRMPNIRGLVESLGGSRAIVLILSAGLVLWFGLRRFRRDTVEFAAAIVAAELVSYHLHMYDLTVLLLPIILALEYAMVERKWVGISVVAILFLTPLQPILWAHRMTYLFSLALLALLIFLSFQDQSQGTNLFAAGTRKVG